MELKEIGTLLFIETGAPVPVVLSNEYKLYLLYYYQKSSVDISNSDMPIERNNKEDRGVAVITFKNHLIYKFGYPNAEALQAHPYYTLGLEAYRLFEVVSSDWVEDIEQKNRVHPFHNPIRYKMYKHFLIAFEDSTFECVAAGMEIEFKPKMTMEEGVRFVSLQFG
jgi:hypothetical protein